MKRGEYDEYDSLHMTDRQEVNISEQKSLRTSEIVRTLLDEVGGITPFEAYKFVQEYYKLMIVDLVANKFLRVYKGLDIKVYTKKKWVMGKVYENHHPKITWSNKTRWKVKTAFRKKYHLDPERYNIEEKGKLVEQSKNTRRRQWRIRGLYEKPTY